MLRQRQRHADAAAAVRRAGGMPAAWVAIVAAVADESVADAGDYP